MKRLSVLLAVVFTAACGSSGSGVSGSKKVVDLSPSEQRDLCEYIVDAQGGPRTIMCDPNTTIEIETVDECVADTAGLSSTCPVTVSQAEACAEALGDLDPCADVAFPAACAPLFECAPQ